MITLKDLSTAELYGLMSMDVVDNPQINNCMLSILSSGPAGRIISTETFVVLGNDYYHVEFLLDTGNNRLIISYNAELENGTLPMYTYSGKETSVWEIEHDWDGLTRKVL